MRLGINIPTTHPDGTAYSMADVAARARAIEAAGFDSIWIGDTLYRGRNLSPDPMMWLLVAATTTQRVEVGVSILQVALRDPKELAKRLVTMHALTRGRFILGVGAGSTQTDFDAMGVDFSQRFHILAERLPILRRLCNGEDVDGINLRPWESARGGPPMLVGSWASPIWIKRAAQEYDGWLASGRTDNQFKTLAEGLQMFRDYGGKRAQIATVGVDLSQNVPLVENQPFNLRCPPAEAADRLARIADLGFDEVMLVKQEQTEEDLPAIRALLPRHAPAVMTR